MYNPSFRVTKKGVPVVSKRELDIMGERFVRDFQPDVLKKPEPVDIDGFVEYYLGMTPDYQFLSHNGVYLGMTVFNDTNKVPVYDPVANRAEYIAAKARTVIIDNRLLEESQRHRYRFTMGHEGSHDILHSGYFSYNPDQLSMFDLPLSPMIQCRVDNPSAKKSDPNLWTDSDRMEWQANRLSSAILMPITAVEIVAKRYPASRSSVKDSFSLILETASVFDVSNEAAMYRLKELGYIPLLGQSDPGFQATAMATTLGLTLN
jgi:Zn-dependent peptidase ImmA (M78 family)